MNRECLIIIPLLGIISVNNIISHQVDIPATQRPRVGGGRGGDRHFFSFNVKNIFPVMRKLLLELSLKMIIERIMVFLVLLIILTTIDGVGVC